MISPARRVQVLRLWHALLLGGVIVAWATGDEDTYAMHLFAGWLVVVALGLRVILWRGNGNRPPILRYSIVAALALTALAAVSGVLADMVPWLEDPHEALAHGLLWAGLAHAAAALYQFKLRRWVMQQRARMLAALSVLCLLAAPAWAGPRDDILAAYARQAAAPFNAQRGEMLFRLKNTVNPDAASCTTCHTADPTAMGRHVKTGRAIEPVAVSANAKRFTDAEKVEERFTRDCQSILGRACTALEKGDYITFMLSK